MCRLHMWLQRGTHRLITLCRHHMWLHRGTHRLIKLCSLNTGQRRVLQHLHAHSKNFQISKFVEAPASN